METLSGTATIHYPLRQEPMLFISKTSAFLRAPCRNGLPAVLAFLLQVALHGAVFSGVKKFSTYSVQYVAFVLDVRACRTGFQDAVSLGEPA